MYEDANIQMGKRHGSELESYMFKIEYCLVDTQIWQQENPKLTFTL